MEVRDGFIIGIFNYCDRWCETCPFTSRCRLFADLAEAESARDPAMSAVVHAPPLPQDIPPPPPRWMEEMFEEMNRISRDIESGKWTPPPEPEPPARHEVLCEVARAYALRWYQWAYARPEFRDVCKPGDPRAVIGWFAGMIGAKVARAVHGLAEDDPADRDWPADFDGSAKVVLVGMDRSLDAWGQVVEREMVTAHDAESFVRQLTWMRDEVAAIFPDARAFIRPAFDEPDEVARFLAAEGCQ